MINVNKVGRGWLEGMDGSDVNPKSQRYNTPTAHIAVVATVAVFLGEEPPSYAAICIV